MRSPTTSSASKPTAARSRSHSRDHLCPQSPLSRRVAGRKRSRPGNAGPRLAGLAWSSFGQVAMTNDGNRQRSRGPKSAQPGGIGKPRRTMATVCAVIAPRRSPLRARLAPSHEVTTHEPVGESLLSSGKSTSELPRHLGLLARADIRFRVVLHRERTFAATLTRTAARTRCRHHGTHALPLASAKSTISGRWSEPMSGPTRSPTLTGKAERASAPRSVRPSIPATVQLGWA